MTFSLLLTICRKERIRFPFLKYSYFHQKFHFISATLLLHPPHYILWEHFFFNHDHPPQKI